MYVIPLFPRLAPLRLLFSTAEFTSLGLTIRIKLLEKEDQYKGCSCGDS